MDRVPVCAGAFARDADEPLPVHVVAIGTSLLPQRVELAVGEWFAWREIFIELRVRAGRGLSWRLPSSAASSGRQSSTLYCIMTLVMCDRAAHSRITLDPTKFKTFLEQLGITYPTARPLEAKPKGL